MSNEDEIFRERAKRMKETHVVGMEVYAERLYLREPLSQIVYNNSDNVKIRIKFADLPCVEIDGTYEEEYITLEAASYRTLRGTITREGDEENASNRDFFRRGRYSLESEHIKMELKKQLMEKRTVNEDDMDEEIPDEEPKSLTKKRVTFSEENKDEENVERPTYTEPSESTINIKVDNGLPFNDSRALIFPTTPQKFLYDLIGKPLKIYLLAYVSEGKAMLIGRTLISLYQMSDIVPHMTMINGGVQSISKMAGTFPLTNNESSEIGEIKVKLRIVSFGTCSYAMVRTLDPIQSSIKFVADEIVEDKSQELPEVTVKDVSGRTAILTGAENTPEVEVLPRITVDNAPTPIERMAEKFMCLKNWRPIYKRT